MRRARTIHTLIPIVILCALWIPGINQGWWRVDTGLYSAIALDAFERGDLLHLHVGAEPYFNKPPLAFWIHGLLLYIFGPHLWVARLGALLAAIGTTLATMRLARMLAGPRAALFSGLALVTTIEFFRYTRAFSLDLWLAFFLTLSLIPVASAFRLNRPGRTALSGVPLGLALLTKPLLALYVPVIAAVWLLWLRKPRHALMLIPATLLAVVIAAPWHAEMIRAYGDTFVDTYFRQQTLDRATSNAFGADPWWYYIGHIASTYWPWLVALAGGAISLRSAAVRRTRHGKGIILGLIWCGLWLIALSVVADKRPRYAILLYPPASLAAGCALARARAPWLHQFMRRVVRWLPVATVAFALIAIALGVRVHRPPSEHWAALSSFLQEHQPDHPTIWVAAPMRTASANVYLMTGQWPQVIPPASDTSPAADQPGTGDWLLLERRHSDALDAQGTVMFQSGKLSIVEFGKTAGSEPKS